MNEINQTKENKSALPAAIVADLEAYGVSASIRAIIEAANPRLSMTSHLVPKTYISLSPADGGYVAAYVHRERMTLAMAPAKAVTVSKEYGWEFDPDSNVTHYVKVPATGLVTEAQKSVALILLLEAIRWRALGSMPSSTYWMGSLTAPAPLNFCHMHNVEGFGGRCPLCPF